MLTNSELLEFGKHESPFTRQVVNISHAYLTLLLWERESLLVILHCFSRFWRALGMYKMDKKIMMNTCFDYGYSREFPGVINN